MELSVALFGVGCATSNSVTTGKDLGWRAIDKLRPVFAHRTDRTEISLIPVPSVD